VRLTEREYAALSAEAATRGSTLAELARAALSHDLPQLSQGVAPTGPARCDAQAVTDLGRLGGLLKTLLVAGAGRSPALDAQVRGVLSRTYAALGGLRS
jgi:hypothetical protein